MTTANELRRMFLDYFIERGHKLVPSAPIVPPDDPTMLFTSAGMVQFKPLWAGMVEPLPYARATSCQKCLRAGGKGSDLENVGKTLRHHTFFEMLGNFSFGDYFKREALQWGWDFVWNVMKLPKERLWATTFEEDDEAARILEEELGIPRDRIIPLNAKENFWGPAGDTGACGPCSEIIFFTGSDAGLEEAKTLDRALIAQSIVEEGDLFFEIWNMVFPQFNQQIDGSRPPLKYRGIDTGAGLERMTTALQYVETKGRVLSPYETDLLAPIVRKTSEVLRKEYVKNADQIIEYLRFLEREEDQQAEPSLTMSQAILAAQKHLTPRFQEVVPFHMFLREIEDVVDQRVEVFSQSMRTEIHVASMYLLEEMDKRRLKISAIADHARALTFALSEGIAPSNEGRGYVLRRILRRALRFGYQMGMDEPFMHKLVEPVVEAMGETYPEIKTSARHAAEVIRIEEERFLRTVAQGSRILDDMIARAKDQEKTVISGDDAFLLHATYGFPVDLTAEIAEDGGLSLDREGFARAMAGHQAEARKSWTGTGALTMPAMRIAGVGRVERAAPGETEFRGYESLECHARVVALIKGETRVEEILAGDDATVVLEESPFYAEAGGQVGDCGTLASEDDNGREAKGNLFEVADTRKTPSGIYLHRGKVARGALQVGDTVTARVDAQRRLATMRNHTVTHLLQSALRKVVGPHITQSGSYVGPEGMRFDFSHVRACTADELRRVERMVNELILDDHAVEVEVLPLEEAQRRGAIAPFGEKYGHKVRVVKIGDPAAGSWVSMEFCGGTHLDRVSRIGSFRLVAESSVAAGIRRIEGVTGLGAYERWAASRDVAAEMGRALSAKEEDLGARLAAMQDDVKRLNREIKRLKQSQSAASIDDLIATAVEVDGLKVVAARLEDADPDQLRVVADQIRDKLAGVVCVLGSASEGKVSLLCAVAKDAVGRIHAGHVIKQVAAIVGGSGGGRPDLAQAGGKQPEKLDEAIAQARQVVASLLKK